MKQKELKFDIEKINDMKKSLSDSADDLNTYKDKVIQSLDKLKKIGIQLLVKILCRMWIPTGLKKLKIT